MHTMNERVDWAAMSDEDLLALVGQTSDSPEVTDPEDD